MKVLCFLRIHAWVYLWNNHRVCGHCRRHQSLTFRVSPTHVVSQVWQ